MMPPITERSSPDKMVIMTDIVVVSINLLILLAIIMLLMVNIKFIQAKDSLTSHKKNSVATVAIQPMDVESSLKTGSKQPMPLM